MGRTDRGNCHVPPFSRGEGSTSALLPEPNRHLCSPSTTTTRVRVWVLVRTLPGTSLKTVLAAELLARCIITVAPTQHLTLRHSYFDIVFLTWPRADFICSLHLKLTSHPDSKCQGSPLTASVSSAFSPIFCSGIPTLRQTRKANPSIVTVIGD